MITGKNYIGGQLSSQGAVTFKTFNPLLNIENSTVFKIRARLGFYLL